MLPYRIITNPSDRLALIDEARSLASKLPGPRKRNQLQTQDMIDAHARIVVIAEMLGVMYPPFKRELAQGPGHTHVRLAPDKNHEQEWEDAVGYPNLGTLERIGSGQDTSGKNKKPVQMAVAMARARAGVTHGRYNDLTDEELREIDRAATQKRLENPTQLMISEQVDVSASVCSHATQVVELEALVAVRDRCIADLEAQVVAYRDRMLEYKNLLREVRERNRKHAEGLENAARGVKSWWNGVHSLDQEPASSAEPVSTYKHPHTPPARP